MNVQQNIQALQEAYDKVKAHPMCARINDDGARFLVIFPEGMWPNGAQCVYGNTISKTKALELLHASMEKAWVNNGISPLRDAS